MEPRGDRLYAIGYDDQSSTSMAVSLFDVSDPANPTQLERVNFGPEWGHMPEDQDRIHKAFRIFDEEGLIVMPFSGWSSNAAGYRKGYHSGIQLIDFTADDLTLRAVVPHKGEARRAFFHDGNLIAMSDERVEAYNIADRDDPRLLSGVKLARWVYRTVPAGDYVAELVGDWWTREARLEIHSIDDPDSFEPVGILDLSSLRPEEAAPYYYWWEGFNYYTPRLFHNGDHIYLLWGENQYYWDYGEPPVNAQLGVAVVDISNPADPQMVRVARFEGTFPATYYRWYSSRAINTGDGVVQVGSTIALLDGAWNEWTTGEAGVRVLDLSDPLAPQLSEPVVVHEGNQTMTLLDGDGVIALSHFEEQDGDANLVKFYLDRIDISDPRNPVLLPAVNIPGAAVAYSEQTGQLFTMDYRRMTMDGEFECFDLQHYDSFFWENDGEGCGYYLYDLVHLQVDGNTATVIDTLDLGDRQPYNVKMTDTTIYMDTRTSWYRWSEGIDSVDPRPRLYAVDVNDDGMLTDRHEWRLDTIYGELIDVQGDVALMVGGYPSTASICHVDEAGVPVVDEEILFDWACETHVTGDRIVVANGPYGVQTIQW